MATSLAVPLAYITVLVTSLAIFSRVYRRRRAAEKTSWEPWFPVHPSRDIYITLLSADPPVPDSLLKSALLVRATADVRRIWRLRDDKIALNSLHQRGLIGDDTMSRFAQAEKELEAEIVDVVSEANTFRPGWGGMIFATASEMAQAEKTRESVMNIGKIKAQEDKRIAYRNKILKIAPTLTNIPNPSAIAPAASASTFQPTSTANSSPSLSSSSPGTQTPGRMSSSVVEKPEIGVGVDASPVVNVGSTSSTPSKNNTPSKKKNKKK